MSKNNLCGKNAMKLKGFFACLLSSNLFGAVEPELYTYDACLGETVAYTCTITIHYPIRSSGGSAAIGKLGQPAPAGNIFLNGPILNFTNHYFKGTSDYNGATNTHVITFTGTLSPDTTNVYIKCDSNITDDNPITSKNYTINPLTLSFPKTYSLSSDSSALTICWNSTSCAQTLTLFKADQLLYSVSLNGTDTSATVPAEKLSPGRYHITLSGLDYPDDSPVSVSSEPFDFVLEPVPAPSLTGELTPLNDNHLKLVVNWTFNPVLPELSAVYIHFDSQPPMELSPDSSSWSQTVEKGSPHSVVIVGENWFGNGSKREFLVDETRNGSPSSATSSATSSFTASLILSAVMVLQHFTGLL